MKNRRGRRRREAFELGARCARFANVAYSPAYTHLPPPHLRHPHGPTIASDEDDDTGYNIPLASWQGIPAADLSVFSDIHYQSFGAVL